MVNVGAPPRGGGSQGEATIQVKSVNGSFAWGSQPATATLVYAPGGAPGGTGGAPVLPVTTGARVDFTIGAHYFAGICESDTQVTSSRGALRHLVFKDMRYFLQWDWVFGAWNMPQVVLINGVRVRRYWHIYPENWWCQERTYTLSPLNGWQILAQALRGPTIFCPWIYDLTSNGLFPLGLLKGPIFEIDANSGMRLDAVLNLICEKTGLVYTLDPLPDVNDFRLVFTRKGYGVLPLPFPLNSDNQRLGTSLTENATNICVCGERNKYQYLNVPMVADWAPGWQQFLDVEAYVLDIFQNESDPVSGNAYTAYPNDPDQWFGYGAARARALELTVSQYVALRAAREGNADSGTFVDNRKFSGRWRMDMPAALYLQTMVFRAFKPDPVNFTLYNRAGRRCRWTARRLRTACCAGCTWIMRREISRRIRRSRWTATDCWRCWVIRWARICSAFRSRTGSTRIFSAPARAAGGACNSRLTTAARESGL